MGAGVAFDKGMQFFHQNRLQEGTAVVRHIVGLSLTIASVLLLSVVLWEYLKGLSCLAHMKEDIPPRFPPAAVASVLVILLGLALVLVLIISG
jgi:uncharacterized membrane protein YidH (DUF202 family)